MGNYMLLTYILSLIFPLGVLLNIEIHCTRPLSGHLFIFVCAKMKIISRTPAYKLLLRIL